MTPAQFKAARHTLGLTAAQMAERLGLSDQRSVRRYESGERRVSGPVALLMARLLEESQHAR